ncbi:hypothetical protein FRC03_001354 [Tulasnella sp. 419]|nr:hypothetical protein FRC03_001354 [Tulasnella sp. 419]
MSTRSSTQVPEPSVMSGLDPETQSQAEPSKASSISYKQKYFALQARHKEATAKHAEYSDVLKTCQDKLFRMTAEKDMLLDSISELSKNEETLLRYLRITPSPPPSSPDRQGLTGTDKK